jgi:hypothetical protein
MIKIRTSVQSLTKQVQVHTLRTAQYSTSTMSTSQIDTIQKKLFQSRLSAPPLEPGTKVFDQTLTKEIDRLNEHEFVRAGKAFHPYRREVG